MRKTRKTAQGDYELTAQQRINAAMLAGRDPIAAAQGIVEHGRGDVNVRQALTSRLIIEDNRLNFEKIGLDKLAPYRTLMDAMITATKRVQETRERVLDDGRIITYNVWIDAPDWGVRMRAADNILKLNGMDPRYELKINVNNAAGGSVSISYGDVAIQVGNASTPEEQLRLYAEMTESAARGELPATIINAELVGGKWTAK